VSSHRLFTDDFKTTPYWWDRTPRPENVDQALPDAADVVIIGSGYTGLSAAIQTAQQGLHTVVVDAEQAGWGCSSRNGGQVSTSLKPTFQELSKKFSADKALEIIREGHNAMDWIRGFIADNNIDCDYHETGRFHAAHDAYHYDWLKHRIESQPKEFKVDARMIPVDQQQEEIGSETYHGGAVFPYHASIDPARYHQGMLRCALDAGVHITGNCRVNDISRSQSIFKVATEKGEIRAKHVIVATSGYTSRTTPWQQRRVIPIGTYMIATEPLPEEQMDRLIPNNRVITDTRKLVVYYRNCPERKRILFGGRVSLNETNPQISGPRLHHELRNRFPELENTRISHSWMGFVGYTFDEMPHLGVHDGVHYCMGYCGAGISLASYFGACIGRQVVGNPEGKTGLDSTPFEGRFYYRGNPWFLAPSIFYYRWRDELLSRVRGIRQAK